MKELSIEEKAKAYNGNYKAYIVLINRLENVKDAIKKQNYGIAMDILCKPYPEFQITTSTELAESEDERIMKDIVEAVELHKDFTQGRKEHIYAWLEKQGEQKPAEEYNITGIGSKNAQGKLGEMIKNLKPVNEVLEQKSAELSEEIPTDLKDIVDKEANAIWKEESTDGCHLVIDSFNMFYGICMQIAEAVVDYKKPVEWSEEDEKEVAVLEAYIRSRDWSDRHIDRALGIVDELVNKVKYLKDRYTWKPSDEQMDALDYYANSLCTYCDRQDDLRSLFNVLKKLREE